MSRMRVAASGVILAAAVALSAHTQVLAQAPRSPEPKATTSEPSTVTKVENWTRKQWNAAKREWSKNKEKWDRCNQQATDRHLTGRKSWSFIYDCMTS
jgi:hypothetical protein